MTSPILCFDQLDLRYASSSVQGRRPYNEDRAYSVHPLIGTQLSDRSTSFFAVYDGHGGEDCAEWCSRQLHNHITRSPDYHRVGSKHLAIEQGFFSCDEELLVKHAEKEAESGTTCSCVLIDHSFIYSGNCGDTRNILCRGGEAIVLTRDHKPTDSEEQTRIESAGAKVTIHQPPPPKNGTLRRGPIPIQAYVELGDAGLAVSRAFGDRSFKLNKEKSSTEQVIVCSPHLTITERKDNDEFILLASDGLWNFLPQEKIIEFVRSRLNSSIASERDLEDIVNKLTQLALDKKSNDNVTVTLIAFNQNKNQEETKNESEKTN